MKSLVIIIAIALSGCMMEYASEKDEYGDIYSVPVPPIDVPGPGDDIEPGDPGDPVDDEGDIIADDDIDIPCPWCN